MIGKSVPALNVYCLKQKPSMRMTLLAAPWFVAQLILMCTVRVRCRALVSHCVVFFQFASSEGVACFHS